MCKTWYIKHTCDHSLGVRLSKCRGTFIQPSRKVACRGFGTLILLSTQACGQCQRSEIERGHEERIAALRASNEDSWLPSQELVDGEQEYEAVSFRLHQLYPVRRYAILPRPQHGLAVSQARGSLLKIEVQPEDVVIRWSTSSSWDDWDDSVEGYKTMEEELAEREAEKHPDLKEHEASMQKTYESWAADDFEPDLTPDDATPLSDKSNMQAPSLAPLSITEMESSTVESTTIPLSPARLGSAGFDDAEDEDRLVEAIRSTKSITGQPKICTTLPERFQCFRGLLTVAR